MEVEQAVPTGVTWSYGPSPSTLTVSKSNGSEASGTCTGLQSPSRVLRVLDELRQGGFFCDAVIRCGDQQFKVQRNILSTCSPYFTALFTYETSTGDGGAGGEAGEGGTQPMLPLAKKKKKAMKEFFIPDMAPEVMELLIKYAYTRDVPVDPATIIQLLPAADRFQMEGLLGACCRSLAHEITLDNCMQIRTFARAFAASSCRQLAQEADRFLLENFTWIYTFSAEFLQMEADDLCQVLANDRLNVRTEGAVLDAVCRWVSYDFDNRYAQCERLLRQVRMGLLTNDSFFRILNYHKLTSVSPAVHSVLLDASKMMAQPEMRASYAQCCPRLPTDLLFVFGGSHLGWPLQIVEAFDIRSLTWKECAALDFGPRSYHGTAVLDQVVYVIGGFDGNDYTNYCTAFHPATGCWAQVAPMHDKRCYVSVTVHDCYVYALGGFDGRTRQRSAERFHPASNQWSMIQPMLCPRSDGGAATLKDKLFILGGFNGQESLNSVEYYDPASNQWTMVRPMRDRRSGVGVAALRNMLYAAGGFNGTRRLSSMEVYDPDTDDWRPLPPMLNARSNFAMTVAEDQLMVIGGYGGRHTTARVEMYDVHSDRWTVSTELSYSRSALSACVVSGLDNVDNFTTRYNPDITDSDDHLHHNLHHGEGGHQDHASDLDD